jgi:hypothetical protein
MRRPKGTPALGEPEPAVNGNSPHTCTVVAWYSAADSTCPARPRPASGQPRRDATRPTGELIGYVRRGRHRRASCGEAGRLPADRRERPVPVRGDLDLHLADRISHHRLGPLPVPGVAPGAALGGVFVIPEVLGELLLQRGFQDRPGQQPQQPVRAGQVLTSRPGQRPPTPGSRHVPAPTARSFSRSSCPANPRPSLSRSSRALPRQLKPACRGHLHRSRDSPWLGRWARLEMSVHSRSYLDPLPWIWMTIS